MAVSGGQVDEYDFLNSVLDEFDHERSSKQSSIKVPSVAVANAAAPLEQQIKGHLDHPTEGGSGHEDAMKLNELFENLLRSMPLNDSADGKSSAAAPTSIEESLKAAANMVNQEASSPSTSASTDEDAMLKSFMDEFNKSGGTEGSAVPENFDDVMQSMMEQMMSKETMYDPIKHVTTIFPKWLHENGHKISDTERSNYEAQMVIFQRIVTHFEGEGSGGSVVMDLMTELQSYGQPPQEIIAALVPGLEYDANGEPVIHDPELVNSLESCSIM